MVDPQKFKEIFRGRKRVNHVMNPKIGSIAHEKSRQESKCEITHHQL